MRKMNETLEKLGAKVILDEGDRIEETWHETSNTPVSQAENSSASLALDELKARMDADKLELSRRAAEMRNKAVEIVRKAQEQLEHAQEEAKSLEAEAKELDGKTGFRTGFDFGTDSSKAKKPAKVTGAKPTDGDVIRAIKANDGSASVGTMAEYLKCDKSLLIPIVRTLVTGKVLKQTGKKRGTKYQVRGKK